MSRALVEAALFFVRQLLHFGVFAFDEHLLGLAQALFDLFPLAIFLDHLRRDRRACLASFW